MDVTLSEASEILPQLIHAVESGEEVVITRDGKPVARITAAAPSRRPINWGSMRDRITFRPGWDDPIDPDRFLEGDL